jgi:hypothetical protein
MYAIFCVGYQVQSNFLADVVEGWIDGSRAAALESFVEFAMSYECLWESSSLSQFEARITGRLLVRLPSDSVVSNLENKLRICGIDLESIQGVLSLRTMPSDIPLDHGTIPPDRNRISVENSINSYLDRGWSTLESMLNDEEMPDSMWNVLPNFLRQSKGLPSIDLEKCLGKICKRDLDGLIPRASSSVEAIFAMDAEAYHRRLPGWLANMFSKMTRRFAEDKILSAPFLESVKQLGMLHSMLSDTQAL